MFHPWKPVSRPLRIHPNLSWRVEGLSLTVTWEEWYDRSCQFRMRIHFADGFVGHLAADESIHFEVAGFPKEEELIKDGKTQLPWPAWRSEKNYHLAAYGDVGAIYYKSLVTYYLHGSETVLMFDINNAEPQITVDEIA